MPYENITATVTDKNLQSIKDAIAEIEAALPFLITLTDDERKKLRKTGEGRLPFVLDAGQAAQDNPDILPKSFDADGFESAVALFNAMAEIHTLLAQLFSQVDDTRLAVGVEALSGASDVYNYVKAASQKTPGLKPLADKLGQLFQKAAATRRANNRAKVSQLAAK